MSPTLIKIAIWVWLLIGLAPMSLLCAASVIAIEVERRSQKIWGSGAAGAYLEIAPNVELHIDEKHAVIQIGMATCEFFPRNWAIGLFYLGMLFIIVALASLLYLPLR